MILGRPVIHKQAFQCGYLRCRVFLRPAYVDANVNAIQDRRKQIDSESLFDTLTHVLIPHPFIPFSADITVLDLLQEADKVGESSTSTVFTTFKSLLGVSVN